LKSEGIRKERGRVGCLLCVNKIFLNEEVEKWFPSNKF
jgi:hypothetical protein